MAAVVTLSLLATSFINQYSIQYSYCCTLKIEPISSSFHSPSLNGNTNCYDLNSLGDRG